MRSQYRNESETRPYLWMKSLSHFFFPLRTIRNSLVFSSSGTSPPRTTAKVFFMIHAYEIDPSTSILSLALVGRHPSITEKSGIRPDNPLVLLDTALRKRKSLLYIMNTCVNNTHTTHTTRRKEGEVCTC